MYSIESTEFNQDVQILTSPILKLDFWYYGQTVFGITMYVKKNNKTSFSNWVEEHFKLNEKKLYIKNEKKKTNHGK